MKRKLRGAHHHGNDVDRNVGCPHISSLLFHRPRRLLSILLLFLFLLSSVANAEDVATNVKAATTTTPRPVATTFSTVSASKGSGSTNNPTATTLVTASNTPVTIPQPFDTTNLDDTGNNFTASSCPQFIRTFLADASFQACVPFSMLLYDSSGFISLTRTVYSPWNWR